MKKIISDKYFNIVLICIVYLSIDLFFRYYTIKSIYFYSIYELAPIFFDFSIIFLNILIIKVLPKKIGLIYFIISLTLNLLFGLVNYFHYKLLGSFFSFSELFMAGEGLEYVTIVFSHISLKLIIVLVIIIILFIIAITSLRKCAVFIPKFKLLLLIIIFQLLGIVFLLIDNNGYSSDSSYSPLNNYIHFETPHRSIETVGYLQYNIQDIIVYYKNLIEDLIKKNEYRKNLDELFANKISNREPNNYTGIFKNKNLIYIMIESGDNWLINEKDMPTLYKMQNEGLNFTNRYAPFFYAGYTINSEFASNTGYYLVDGYKEYINNSFPNSLPNLFKKSDYIVNAFHMNNPSFYNRDILHKSLGYYNHYGNYNNSSYLQKGYDYVNDVNWILNDETYNLLVPKTDKKFMSFLVTYTMHLPYFNNSLCEQAIKDNKITYKSWEKREEICLRYLASQTDEMLNKLLERLKEDKLIDDTIIVLFADHNTYGFSDKDYLAKVKGTDNLSLQQKTPLIIWGTDIKHKNINTIMDTADLVPTIANMFGLDYDDKYYISTDVFSKNHDKYVYFNYGYVLNENKEFVDDGSNDDGKNMININKMILKTDYLKDKEI